MLKTTGFLSAFLISSVCLAQSAYGVTMDSIQLWVEADLGYYKDLQNRIVSVDFELEPNEFFLAYYASAYLDGYSPYGEQTMRMTLSEMENQENHLQFISTAKNILKSYPLYVRGYLDLGRAYELQGDSSNATAYYSRYADLLSIPFYSGTGKSIDSAFVVRSVDDEYLILGELGYDLVSQGLIVEEGIPYDVMSVKYTDENDKIVNEDVYFNIYQPYVLGLAKMFSEKDEAQEPKKAKRKKKSRD